MLRFNGGTWCEGRAGRSSGALRALQSAWKEYGGCTGSVGIENATRMRW
jgi:hypothetical protein